MHASHHFLCHHSVSPGIRLLFAEFLILRVVAARFLPMPGSATGKEEKENGQIFHRISAMPEGNAILSFPWL